jgi:tRNA threonylcarbamoyl adenosine modification protein YeaZ/ribosomal-protein-alanine acetyltransferase
MLLAFDTCLGSCSAAVFDTSLKRVMAARRVLMDRGHAEALPPMVRDVMAEAGVAFEALQAIAVTVGPGTFTGLRIGLSLAKGLAAARATPLIGLTSLEATAGPLLQQDQAVTVVHEAGASGFAYVQGFGADGQPAGSVQLLRPADISIDPLGVVVGTGARLIAGGVVRRPEFDLPDAALFASYAALRTAVSHELVQPLYVREPDAKPSAATRSVEGRFVTDDDLPLIAKLHRISFETPWSEAQFKDALALPGAAALAVLSEGQMRGFVHFQIAVDQAEIHTLCVEPRWRRKGFGRDLLTSLEAIARMRGITELRLDVAADNGAALQLYRQFGFKEAGRRKGYYARVGGAVDALLMTFKL